MFSNGLMRSITHSATPPSDLQTTKFANIKVSNRKNEEIVIISKGKDGGGFGVCRQCGAAKLHDGKPLKEPVFY